MNDKLNKIKIFLFCPIPDEQKPINEYIQLIKYTNLSFKESFKKKYNSLFFNNFSFISKIKYILDLFIKNIINIFLLIRWKEIEKRFSEPTIFYEEGSWYDGQIWEKPFSLIKNDHILNSQIIRPIIKKNIIFLIVFMFILFLTLNN